MKDIVFINWSKKRVANIHLQENLVESKHHKLARSLRSGPSDKDSKPNASTRDQLNVCINILRAAFRDVVLAYTHGITRKYK